MTNIATLKPHQNMVTFTDAAAEAPFAAGTNFIIETTPGNLNTAELVNTISHATFAEPWVADGYVQIPHSTGTLEAFFLDAKDIGLTGVGNDTIANLLNNMTANTINYGAGTPQAIAADANLELAYSGTPAIPTEFDHHGVLNFSHLWS